MSTFALIILGLPSICFARPPSLDEFYNAWKPLELVRGLRALSVDPFDVFRSLEAVKDLDSDEALDVMHGLNVRPIVIYDALSDLGVDPFNAYYALKSWLTDPLLHQPGDHYHRVNASGDPSHPHLHVSYSRAQSVDGQPKDEYKAQFLNSEEINKALENIEKEYKDTLQSHKIKMSDFVNKAKHIHSAFDDPQKVFKDFFGERHFNEWKNLFPEAFKGLTDIYKNPLGFSLRGTLRKQENMSTNGTVGHHETYEHLHKGSQFQNQQQQASQWTGPPPAATVASQGRCTFSQFNDPNRYDTLQDETYIERENSPAGAQDGKNKTHYIKRYYDKLRNMYIECKRTEEYIQAGHGKARRVQSNVRYFDPKSYQQYREQLQQHHQQTQSQQQVPSPQGQPQQQPPPQGQPQQQLPPQGQPQQPQQGQYPYGQPQQPQQQPPYSYGQPQQPQQQPPPQGQSPQQSSPQQQTQQDHNRYHEEQVQRARRFWSDPFSFFF